MRDGRSQTGSLLRAIAFLLVVAAIIGFGNYAGTVTGYKLPPADNRSDAIIVLTGDAGRLAAGTELLRAGQAPHLLISGVNPSTTPGDIQRSTGLSDAELACCVTLGRDATDTVGNAREASELVRANGYRRLIIVTSDYHLPRSLLEMKMLMPGVELTPYPVRTTPPWRDLGAGRLWLQEYAKYTAVWLLQPFAPRPDTA